MLGIRISQKIFIFPDFIVGTTLLKNQELTLCERMLYYNYLLGL